MRGLYGLKATATPAMQLSRLYNKRVQNEAKGSLEGFRHTRGTA